MTSSTSSVYRFVSGFKAEWIGCLFVLHSDKKKVESPRRVPSHRVAKASTYWMTKDYAVSALPLWCKHHKVYACLFTRQKEKSSLTKLGPVCFKKYLSECIGHNFSTVPGGIGTSQLSKTGSISNIGKVNIGISAKMWCWPIPTGGPCQQNHYTPGGLMDNKGVKNPILDLQIEQSLLQIYQSCLRHSWLLQAKVLSAPPITLQNTSTPEPLS